MVWLDVVEKTWELYAKLGSRTSWPGGMMFIASRKGNFSGGVLKSIDAATYLLFASSSSSCCCCCCCGCRRHRHRRRSVYVARFRVMLTDLPHCMFEVLKAK